VKDELIEGIHGLAEDVAVEYCSLKRYAKAETECLRKKADNRLTINLKKSKERESGLRDSLDSLKEEHEVMSAAAQDEIADLKKTISCLETQLADAKKELTVSKAFAIGIVIVANDN
jgi:predicted  nucleic acid-binding Zn-ribbon protein